MSEAPYSPDLDEVLGDAPQLREWWKAEYHSIDDAVEYLLKATKRKRSFDGGLERQYQQITKAARSATLSGTLPSREHDNRHWVTRDDFLAWARSTGEGIRAELETTPPGLEVWMLTLPAPDSDGIIPSLSGCLSIRGATMATGRALFGDTWSDEDVDAKRIPHLIDEESDNLKRLLARYLAATHGPDWWHRLRLNDRLTNYPDFRPDEKQSLFFVMEVSRPDLWRNAVTGEAFASAFAPITDTDRQAVEALIPADRMRELGVGAKQDAELARAARDRLKEARQHLHALLKGAPSDFSGALPSFCWTQSRAPLHIPAELWWEGAPHGYGGTWVGSAFECSWAKACHLSDFMSDIETVPHLIEKSWEIRRDWRRKFAAAWSRRCPVCASRC